MEYPMMMDMSSHKSIGVDHPPDNDQDARKRTRHPVPAFFGEINEKGSLLVLARLQNLLFFYFFGLNATSTMTSFVRK